MKRSRGKVELEEFSPFDKARFNRGVPDLDEFLAHQMFAEVDRRCKQNGFNSPEAEMEFVLDLNEIWNEDYRSAYKSFFGYTWAAQRRKREKDRDEAFKRDFAPVDEDGILY